MKEKTIFKGFLDKRSYPSNFDIKDVNLFKNDLEITVPDIKTISYSSICINSDLLLWKNFSFLKESYKYREENHSRLNKIKFLLKSSITPKVKLKKALWIIDSWSEVYYHWIFDVLQKSTLLKKEKGVKILIPQSFLQHEYIKESIRILKLEIEIIKPNSIIKVEKLLTLPTVIYSGMFINEKIIEIRNNILSNINQKRDTERIYISRKNAVRRKVINEKQVIEVLKTHNFKVYYLEELSWQTQLSIFKNSNTIISIHGSGLSNMLFLKNKSNIVEFRHPNSASNNPFYALSSTLKFNYFYILGVPSSDNSHESDLFIDLKELKNVINSLKYD